MKPSLVAALNKFITFLLQYPLNITLRAEIYEYGIVKSYMCISVDISRFVAHCYNPMITAPECVVEMKTKRDITIALRYPNSYLLMTTAKRLEQEK
jgi:hypothetical protein